MDHAYRSALARPAGVLRQLVYRLETLPPLGTQRGVREDFQGLIWRTRHGVRAHRRHNHQGPPARHRRKRGTQNQAIGKSRGGLTTKAVALVDALGNLVRFILLPGNRHDSVGVMPLIADIDFKALIADKAFDNNAIRAGWTSVARLPSSLRRPTESRLFPTMRRCTSGGI